MSAASNLAVQVRRQEVCISSDVRDTDMLMYLVEILMSLVKHVGSW
jgi:hypothetical protein